MPIILGENVWKKLKLALGLRDTGWGTIIWLIS